MRYFDSVKSFRDLLLGEGDFDGGETFTPGDVRANFGRHERDDRNLADFFGDQDILYKVFPQRDLQLGRIGIIDCVRDPEVMRILRSMAEKCQRQVADCLAEREGVNVVSVCGNGTWNPVLGNADMVVKKVEKLLIDDDVREKLSKLFWKKRSDPRMKFIVPEEFFRAYYGSSEYDGDLFYTFCRAPNMSDYADLFDVLRNNDGLGEDGVPVSVMMKIFVDALEGVQLLHENGFIHGDVQPRNIMVVPDGEDGVGKICDFELVREQGGNDFRYGHEFFGDFYYWDSQFSDNTMHLGRDVFAAGISVLMILCGGDGRKFRNLKGNLMRYFHGFTVETAGDFVGEWKILATVFENSGVALPRPLLQKMVQILSPYPADRGSMSDLIEVLKEVYSLRTGSGGVESASRIVEGNAFF